jgi:hypothetical protein
MLCDVAILLKGYVSPLLLLLLPPPLLLYAG